MSQSRLVVVPCSLERARNYILTLHRHHTPDTTRTRWPIAAADEDGVVRGIALVGYPVSRFQDDGWTLEVHRVATDGCPNACSILYGASARLAKALGFAGIVTYIRADEPGTSLRAAGWVEEGRWDQGLSWADSNRGRKQKTEVTPRARWGVRFTSVEPRELAWPHVPQPDQIEMDFSNASEDSTVSRPASSGEVQVRSLADAWSAA